MSSIEKTAYPRFPKRKKIKQDELNRSYSLRQDEVNIIKLAAKTDKSRFNMAIQLKTFQRLGYFVEIEKIPSEIVVHVRQSLKYHYRLTPGYGVNNKSIYRHRQKIREFLKVNRWGYEEIDGKKVHQGMKLAIKFAYDASVLMNNIPDIINVVIEKLVHASYELPSFYKLNRLVRHTRHTVNNRIFSETMKRIMATNQSEVFKQLLILQDATQRTLFDKIKNLPKRPTIDRFQDYLDHFHWLISFGNVMHCLNASRKLTPEQTAAFEHLTAEGDLKCVVGLTGTGKSYLLGATRQAWEDQGYRVLGATLSGIAAQNLTGSSGIESRTLASRFYYWDKGEQLLTSRDILVIDEAGMIGSRQMTRMLEQAKNNGAKVVLIGDPEQLQAIEAGAAFRAISQRTGYVELMDVRRQQYEWQKEATREFATAQTAQAIARYSEHNHVHEFKTNLDAKQGLISLWNDARISSPETPQIILAYTRKEVAELNQMARDVRRALGELGADHTISTVRGEINLAPSDRVYFLKNDRQLGVMNGTLGSVQSIDDGYITIALDKKEAMSKEAPRTVTIHLDQYNHITHGYAATIHKAQGVTVGRSYILASNLMDRHATYVAQTRHTESADLFYGRDVFSNERELAYTLGRERSKDVSIDYQGNKKIFADHRGIDGSHQNDKLQYQALEAEAMIRKLAKNVADAPGQREARDALGSYVVKIAQQEGIMSYFAQHHPEFEKQINQLVHAYQPIAERNRGWERDERGL